MYVLCIDFYVIDGEKRDGILMMKFINGFKSRKANNSVFSTIQSLFYPQQNIEPPLPEDDKDDTDNKDGEIKEEEKREYDSRKPQYDGSLWSYISSVITFVKQTSLSIFKLVHFSSSSKPPITQGDGHS